MKRVTELVIDDVRQAPGVPAAVALAIKVDALAVVERVARVVDVHVHGHRSVQKIERRELLGILTDACGVDERGHLRFGVFAAGCPHGAPAGRQTERLRRVLARGVVDVGALANRAHGDVRRAVSTPCQQARGVAGGAGAAHADVGQRRRILLVSCAWASLGHVEHHRAAGKAQRLLTRHHLAAGGIDIHRPFADRLRVHDDRHSSDIRHGVRLVERQHQRRLNRGDRRLGGDVREQPRARRSGGDAVVDDGRRQPRRHMWSRLRADHEHPIVLEAKADLAAEHTALAQADGTHAVVEVVGDEIKIAGGAPRREQPDVTLQERPRKRRRHIARRDAARHIDPAAEDPRRHIRGAVPHPTRVTAHLTLQPSEAHHHRPRRLIPDQITRLSRIDVKIRRDLESGEPVRIRRLLHRTRFRSHTTHTHQQQQPNRSHEPSKPASRPTGSRLPADTRSVKQVQ